MRRSTGGPVYSCAAAGASAGGSGSKRDGLKDGTLYGISVIFAEGADDGDPLIPTGGGDGPIGIRRSTGGPVYSCAAMGASAGGSGSTRPLNSSQFKSSSILPYSSSPAVSLLKLS
jgi:hypothetical protein